MIQKQITGIQVLEALRRARDYFDPSNVTYLSKNTNYTDSDTEFVFTSSDEFLNTLHEFGFQGKTLKEAGFELEDWYELLKEQSSNTTPVPTYVTNTTLTPENIADFEKDIERIRESEKVRADQKRETERFEKRNKEIFAEQQRIRDEIKSAEEATTKLAGKVVFAKVTLPEPIPLNEVEQSELELLRQYAQDESVPEEGVFTKKQVLIEKLTNEVEAKIKPLMPGVADEVIVREARTIAVQITNEIADPDTVIDKKINSAVYYSIANDTQTITQILPKNDGILTVAKKGSALILFDELQKNDLKHQVLKKLVGPNLAKAIEGPEFDEIKVTLSTVRPDGTYNEVSFNSININYQSSLNHKSDLVDKAQEIGADEMRSLISNSIGAPVRSFASEKIKALQKAGKLPVSPGLDGIFAKYGIGVSPKFIYTSEAGRFAEKYLPEYIPYLKLFSEVTGVSVGIGVSSKVIPLTFGGGIQVGKIVAIQQISIAKAPFTYATATGNVIKIGAGAKAAGQVASKGFAATIATAIGVATGWVTAGIGLLIGWISGIIIKNWPRITRWFRENGWVLGVGSGVVGAILFGAGPGLGIGIVVTGSIIGFGTLATGAFGLLGFIGRSIGIATPVIITLLVIPPLVAFIMLVINNSAYVVPPGKSILAARQENPYISVTKIAEPSGPFENSQLPLTIKYTITVVAKKDSLLNIRFEHKCKVIKEDSTQDCAAPVESPPTTISPTTPYVYSYETIYNSTYNDALVINTFTATADTLDKKDQSASGVASITIGDPPTNCFEVDEGSFSGNGLTYITNSVAKLMEHNGYSSKICASLGGNKIEIIFGGSNGDYWGYYSEGRVKIYERGLASQEDTNYILFHEMAHVLAVNDDSWYDQYLSFPGINNDPHPYCFYNYENEQEGGWPFSERFAEAASFYANDPCGNFKQTSSAHYKFMNDVLFK